MWFAGSQQVRCPLPSHPPGTTENLRGHCSHPTQILWTICIRIMLKLRFLHPIPDLLSQLLDPGIQFGKLLGHSHATRYLKTIVLESRI